MSRKRGGKGKNFGRRALNQRFDRTAEERRRSGSMRASYAGGFETRLNTRNRKSQATSEAQHNTRIERVQVAEALRESDRKNGVFKRCLNALVENAVGEGYTVVPQTDDDGWNKAAHELYQERCARENFTPHQLNDEWRYHQLVCRTHQRDGEVLVYHAEKGTQLFEGGQITTPTGMRGNERVRDGFVFNEKGGWEGCYVGPYSKFGYVKASDAVFLPAWHTDRRRNIKLPVLNYIHHSDFVSGMRGMSPFAASLENLERLGDFVDAVLERAINEACIMGALYSDDPNAHDSINTAREGDNNSRTDGSGKKQYDKLDYVEPAIVAHFKKQDTFELHDPKTPNSRFNEFTKFMLRMVGLPGAVPIELSMLDFSDTNFSGHRAAIEQAKRLWVMLQHYYCAEWTTPNYLWTLYEAIQEGNLTMRDDWQEHTVRPNGWRYLQPKEDAQANAQRLKNGEATLTDILAEQGKGSLRQHLKLKAKEIKENDQVADEEGVDREKLLSYVYNSPPGGDNADSQSDSTE